ncbi:MAG: wax ester/triacylglycerol synthase family O-acyltransferase [Acidobacteriia bacterium]|nr:wax ester/triacylglycerol synthase family O-acyltransferase [Terriglobia bacterium]
MGLVPIRSELAAAMPNKDRASAHEKLGRNRPQPYGRADMPNAQDGRRLSWGDTVFLYLEREDSPLNVAGVSAFEGVISLRACRQFIESKLPLIPRYRQRVVAPPWNIGLPTWENDPDFDVRNHIRQVTLKRGTDAEFKAVAGKILGKVMDRQRPLWDLTLVRGLKGNRTGFILRVHHCLADGIAGVGLMNVMMDASPVAPPLPKKVRRFHAPPPRDTATMLLDGWITSFFDAIQHVLSAQTDVLNLVEKVVASGGEWPVGEFARLLPELTAPTERLQFNVTCRGPQKFAWAEIPFGEIKAIHDACGSTVNDVVLALVTSTIRRYAEFHGEPVRGRLLRIMVPVNLRGSGNPGDLGNRISLVPVTIPLDIRNSRKLLSAIHERTEFLKRAHVAELVALTAGLLGALPNPLQALAGPVASQLPITPFNLVCTNVPGPQFPLYLLGHKMLSWYPYVPIGGEMTVNCAILSYNGTAYFGFTGDAHAVPDLGRLEGLLKVSLAELQKAARIGVQRKKRPRPKAEVVPVPAPGNARPISSAPARPAAEAVPAKRPAPVEDRVQVGLAAD